MKSSATRKQEISLAKRIEDVRFRIDSLRCGFLNDLKKVYLIASLLLRQERDRLSSEVRSRQTDIRKVLCPNLDHHTYSIKRLERDLRQPRAC